MASISRPLRLVFGLCALVVLSGSLLRSPASATPSACIGDCDSDAMSAPLLHSDGLYRCPWPGRDDALYLAYHDEEWGVPEYDDRALYEKLVLDGFQAGLSWITILRKRDNFRRAFAGFDPRKIARYDARKKAALMQDAGIVRNRLKIEGAVLAARGFKFVGPTIVYAFMQAVGMVNDHLVKCHRHEACRRPIGRSSE